MISDILVSGEMVRVLDFLLDDPFSEYTQIEISEGSNVSRPTVSKVISRLKQLKVLSESRKFGKTVLYTVNRTSPIVSSLIKFDVELSKAMVLAGIDDLNLDVDFGSNVLEIGFPEIPSKHSWHRNVATTGEANYAPMANPSAA